MKTLIDHIKNNPSAFDRELPSVGHFERFERRLEEQTGKRNRQWNRWIITTSVAAMLAITLIFQFTHMIHTQPRPDTESVQEVTNYYNIQLKDEVEKIKLKIQFLDPGSRQELLNDIQTLLTDSKDLNNPRLKMSNEERIAWIMNQYTIKMENLCHIQSLLENIQTKNNTL